MARINVNIRDNTRIAEVIADIRKMNNKKAKVGYKAGTEQEMIAKVHEYGARIRVTDKMRGYLASQGMHLKASTTHIVIPERSFLRTGSEQGMRDVQRKAEELIESVLVGNVSVDLFFEALGLELKGKVQEFAIDLDDPRNHPFTVERKGSSNPLVDSGGMIGAMEVEVE